MCRSASKMKLRKYVFELISDQLENNKSFKTCEIRNIIFAVYYKTYVYALLNDYANRKTRHY